MTVTLNCRGTMGPHRGALLDTCVHTRVPTCPAEEASAQSSGPKLPEGEDGIQPFTQTHTQGRCPPLRDPVTCPWARGGRVQAGQ